MTNKPSEAQIQSAFFDWARAHHPRSVLNTLMWAIPNGGSRHIREAVNLKRQGVKSGVPDVVLHVPSGKYHGLFLEFKTTAGQIRKEQKIVMGDLTANGYLAVVVRSTEDAIDVVTKYLMDSEHSLK